MLQDLAELGPHLPLVRGALDGLAETDAVGRIWRKDHTLWRPDPTEISDRLGWLDVCDTMAEQVPHLEAFAAEVRDSGIRDVVLLGMGGSSLGPEILRRTFGSSPGYPQLTLLDSTVPAWVRKVTGAIDPAKSLFIVSSKSGTTNETLSFYAHFRDQVEKRVGPRGAGGHFVAITDPGTPLDRLGQERGFRKVFLNPSDVGGRYSVLSYFGLVPASLMGLDITRLLERGRGMQRACTPGDTNERESRRLAGGDPWVPCPGRSGQDDYPCVPLHCQLRPLGRADAGREHRQGGARHHTGGGRAPPGPPTTTVTTGYSYTCATGVTRRRRWTWPFSGCSRRVSPWSAWRCGTSTTLAPSSTAGEYATAVAGSLLGIHPFDQPNVQGAKDMTDSVLGDYQARGKLPEVGGLGSLNEILSGVDRGDYLAIMAYLLQTPDLDRQVDRLRRAVMERYRIATTMGYGPRYLHSTGQIHKGGPSKGIFPQITSGHAEDLPIPGAPYSFGVLADAQALGDLEALQSSGRRVARVVLDPTGGPAIEELTSAIEGRTGP